MKDTYVEINLDNIASNARNIVKKYNQYDYYIGVLKSDAYGHGEYIVNELYENGINYFAVSYINEALDIRKYNKDVPILLLQPINLNQIDVVVNNNITITVHDFNYLKELLKLDKNVKIHLKIDSGMCRLGFNDKNEIKEAVDLLNASKNVFLEGIYSHFATVGIIDNKWDKQLAKFKELTKDIDLKSIPIVHLGSSTTLLGHPKIEFCNGIRMGIVLYGYNVSNSKSNKGLKNVLRNIRNSYLKHRFKISDTYFNVEIDLKPAMKLKTGILQIKKIKKGSSIGYQANYTTKEDCLIAVLPIGYNNGIGRKNINKVVSINNKKYPVLGNIGMNMITIKVDNNVNINDTVTILGDDITLGMLSRSSDYIISETLTNIGKSNKKVYIKDGKKVY